SAAPISYRPRPIVSNRSWIVLGAYYAFIFSTPFQTVDIGLPAFGTLSKLIGYLFVITTALKPRLCFKNPPVAIYFFIIYLLVFICSAAPTGDVLIPNTLIQLLVLFWLSCNLLKSSNQVIRRSLFAFATGCVVLALIMALGFDQEAMEGRATALDANPNTVAG